MQDNALNLWVDADGELAFAEAVIGRADLPGPSRADLATRINRIRERAADPNLYLAVIGEFSGGKSTFINALLGEPLLPSSVLVTTGTATWLRHGEQLDVTLKLANRTRPLQYRRGPAALLKALTTRGVPSTKLPADALPDDAAIRAFIGHVTQEEALTRHLERVEIAHPDPFLADGVVVIDTPGLNAEVARHAEIAHAVVEQDADAAVVVIPAMRQLPMTLRDFLAGPLRPFLHHCVFVVTQMDKIRERDQGQVLDAIRGQVQAHLGLDNPPIYAAAAQVALAALSGEEEVPVELVPWAGRFAELEEELRRRLEHERALAIAEHTVRLLTDLFEQISRQLSERQADHQRTATALAGAGVADLDAFVAPQRREGRQLIDTAAQNARRKVEEALAVRQRNAQQRLEMAIREANSTSDLKTVMEEKADEILKDEVENLQRTVAAAAKEIDSVVEAANRQVDARFEQAYRSLQALDGVRRRTAGAAALEADTASVVAALKAMQADWASREDDAGGIGALGGGLLGTALIPIPFFGTVVGMMIGGLVGQFLESFFGPSLEERKHRAKEVLTREVNEFFVGLKPKVGEAIDHRARAAKQALEHRLKDYRATYRAAVDALRQSQEQERAALAAAERTVAADLTEIERRRHELHRRREVLASSGATTPVTVRAREGKGNDNDKFHIDAPSQLAASPRGLADGG